MFSASGMADRDKIQMVMNSKIERGSAEGPVEPDMAVGFSFDRTTGGRSCAS